jgi:hypothetical protein
MPRDRQLPENRHWSSSDSSKSASPKQGSSRRGSRRR